LATYETAPGRGLPIGNLISQHLANFYLGAFDHWLQEELRVAGYLRYMDDFLLFADEPSRLKEQLAHLEEFLAARLKLTLKDNVQLNRSARGIPFLGYRVYPGRLRLAPAARRRLAGKLKLNEKLFRAGHRLHGTSGQTAANRRPYRGRFPELAQPPGAWNPAGRKGRRPDAAISIIGTSRWSGRGPTAPPVPA